jgi:hypothetical protein
LIEIRKKDKNNINDVIRLRLISDLCLGFHMDGTAFIRNKVKFDLQYLVDPRLGIELILYKIRTVINHDLVNKIEIDKLLN